MTQVTRLLIANRGEIARRIMRTARAMGIGTVAIYAEPDSGAPFVREADIAVALKGASARDTYLDVANVLDAARRAGADAVHPGYGFLSENSAFARAVIDAGLTWVGPSPAAIAAMGDKLAAKKMMVAAGVPTLPSAEVGEDGADLAAAAAAVGYPLLVKAAAGGGGKGMRIVRDQGALAEAVESARREAAASFSDGTVFLERYLDEPRHVEIQVLGDSHGNLIHCFERECSIQRRHQKIIEEAPSPAMTEELREQMGLAAVAAAQAIGYSSAGTVEFLVDANRQFYFLEMNTRLQVEHPVTEAITGLDLVREQLRVAMGERLDVHQAGLAIRGHAIEARLYAEDPANEFLPATGRVLAWEPPADPPARFDSGVERGSEVTVHFDPLLAKVIVHAPTRTEAALRLARVLERTRVHGVVTNRDFLVATLRHPAFLAGDTTTAFIEKYRPAAVRTPSPAELRTAAIAAALAGQEQRRAEAKVLTTVASGWRNSPNPMQETKFRHGESEVVVHYARQRDGTFAIRAGGEEGGARVLGWTGSTIDVEVDGVRSVLGVLESGGRWWVQSSAGEVALAELPRFPVRGPEEVLGGLIAPMPGKIVAVNVAVGDTVTAGQVLVVMEAMKMEHRISAPANGTVAEVRAVPGDQVEPGAVLVVLHEEGAR